MSNRRGANERTMRFCGAELPAVRVVGGDYLPSKKDLFDLLHSLQYREPPEKRRAREDFDEATKARQKFERSNKTWMQLRKAEMAAKRELGKVRDLEVERWKEEIAACRDMIRLNGVTPAVKIRIERMVNGDGEE